MNAMPSLPPIGDAWLERAKAPNRELREAATQLVSDGLVAPALATLHHSPMRPASGPFAMSPLEKRFAPLLQAHLAERVTQAARFPLIDTIVDRFERMSQARDGGLLT